MNNNLKVQLQELSGSFTPDAWQLISSFLTNLQKKMDQFDITPEQRSTIYNGIEEFIQEFVEDYSDKAKINFDEALALIQEIGSPSEILQAMEMPVERVTAQKTVSVPTKPVKNRCSSCNWANESDARFCENCGRRLTEVVDTTESSFLPKIFTTYPNVTSILISYFIFIIAVIVEVGVPLVLIIPDSEKDPSLIPTIWGVALIIMIPPAVIFGLIGSYLITQLDQVQKASRMPELQQMHSSPLPSEIMEHPTLASVLISYMIFLIIATIEGFIVYFSEGSDNEWLMSTMLPIVTLAFIVPAVCIGLIGGFLIDRLSQIQKSAKYAEIERTRKGVYIPWEIIDHPYTALVLLSYLVLLALGNIQIALDFPSRLPGEESDLFNRLSDVATGTLIPAVILGLISGYLITQIYREKRSPQYKHDIHFAHFQRYFSLGLILTLISAWLFWIFSPIRVNETEFGIWVISLLLGGFILLIWLYKWNDGNKPYDLPYLVLARYKKSLDFYNSKKLRDYTIVGSMVILMAVYVIWENNGVWYGATVLEAPAWFAAVFSLILMLYGVLLMNFYSWTRIKRFIRLME